MLLKFRGLFSNITGNKIANELIVPEYRIISLEKLKIGHYNVEFDSKLNLPKCVSFEILKIQDNFKYRTIDWIML